MVRGAEDLTESPKSSSSKLETVKTRLGVYNVERKREIPLLLNAEPPHATA